MNLRVLCRIAGALGCVILAAPGFAAEFLLKTWRTDDGLPDTTVTAIQQTRDGYLWVGSRVGLVRFDGVRFVHFSAVNLPELGTSPVSRLFEDRSGTFWIALESGRLVAWRDGKARIFRPDAKSANEAIVAMAEDASGRIWLQTSDGRLGRTMSDGIEFVASTGPVDRRTRLGLVVDETGTLWVGTKDGLRIWEDGRLRRSAGVAAMEGLAVDAMARAGEGGIWVYADHRLWRIRDRRVALQWGGPKRLTGSAVGLVEAFGRRPWVAAEGGRLFYFDADDTWKLIGSEAGLRSLNLALHVDCEGNLWRGGMGGGLTRVRPSIFELHERPPTDPDRQAGSVCADAAGDVWAMLNSRSLASISRTGEIKIWGTRETTSPFRTLFRDRQGVLWCGSAQRMVSRLTDGVLVPAFVVDREANGINAFFEDSEGNLWIGFSGGAGAGFMRDGNPRQWRPAEGLPFRDICAIGQSSDGAMWFGTSRGGACRLKDGQWTRYTTRDGLPSDVVRCFHMEPDGTVWMGTLKGLARWQNGLISSITAEHGLWSDAIYCILDDRAGNLWMSSPTGIFRASVRQLHEFADGSRDSVQSTGYNRSDGMAAQECSGGMQPAGARTPDGRLWFPTADGLVSIDSARVVDNPLPPPVRIEEVIIDGASRILQPEDRTLKAEAGKNRVGFRFTALSFTSPEKVRFRYRLDGVDLDWSPPDAQRSVVYRFVPPGRYTFRVIASNNSGVWSPTEATLALVVQPFFWQTTSFKVALGIILAVGLVTAVRRRERRRAQLQLERVQREHALDRERARIAKDIHDDIGASLTQIAFMSVRVDSARQDAAEVERWNRRIAQTAQNTIRSLDEIVWAVSPKHDTLESLANYLGRFAQEHLALAGIECRLEIPTVLPSIILNADVRHNVLLSVREALQNIVTHSGASQAAVVLEVRRSTLEISVSDNGPSVGVNGSPQGGNGIPNMRTRMEEVGGGFDIVANPGKGIEVKLTVPLPGLLAKRNTQPGGSGQVSAGPLPDESAGD